MEATEMIMTGTKMIMKDTGKLVVLLDGWSLHPDGLPIMHTDGTITRLSDFGQVRHESAPWGGERVMTPDPDHPEYRSLSLMWDIYGRWQEYERVGRMIRNKETGDAIRFAAFRKVLAEYDEPPAKGPVREFGPVSVFADCVHCGESALRARYEVPLCLGTECLTREMEATA